MHNWRLRYKGGHGKRSETPIDLSRQVSMERTFNLVNKKDALVSDCNLSSDYFEISFTNFEFFWIELLFFFLFVFLSFSLPFSHSFEHNQISTGQMMTHMKRTDTKTVVGRPTML